MKILWFTNTPSKGEEQLACFTTSGGWIKSLDSRIQNQVELHVAFHYSKKMPPFNYGSTMYYPIGPKFGIISKILERLNVPSNPAEYQDAYLEIIEKVKPDIIHIHGSENSFGIILGKTSIPVILSVQGIVSEIERKYFTIDSRISSYSFKRAYKHYSDLARLERMTLSRGEFLISKSKWSDRILSVMAPKAKIYRLNNILRDTFYSSRWDKIYRSGERLIITSISSDRYFKGFETICESISILTEMKMDFTWKVAGIDPQSDFVSLIRKKLNKVFPKENLQLLGRLTEAEIGEMLLGSHIYVMTSHIENSPNNLCEAMMLGMPCIASFSGGTSSMLQDEFEGTLVPDNDPIAISGAILEYVNDPGKAYNYGIKARSRAMERHDPDSVVSSLLSIYRSILS